MRVERRGGYATASFPMIRSRRRVFLNHQSPPLLLLPFCCLLLTAGLQIKQCHNIALRKREKKRKSTKDSACFPPPSVVWESGLNFDPARRDDIPPRSRWKSGGVGVPPFLLRATTNCECQGINYQEDVQASSAPPSLLTFPRKKTPQTQFEQDQNKKKSPLIAQMGKGDFRGLELYSVSPPTLA